MENVILFWQFSCENPKIQAGRKCMLIGYVKKLKM